MKKNLFGRYRGRRVLPAMLAAILLAGGIRGSALAAEPGALHSAEEMEHLADNTLEWYEIDGLISEYNAAVVKNRNEYNTDKRRTYDAQQVRDYLIEQADDMDAEADTLADTSAMLSASNRVLANQLRLQAESSVLDGRVLQLGYDLVEKQTAANARTAFLNYYGSLYETEFAEQNIAYLERLYASAQNRRNFGMGTETELLTAKENLENARAGLLSTRTTLANTRNALLVMCGWVYDSDGVIGPLPAMTPEEALAVDPAADRETANAANLTLQMDRIKLDNARKGSYTVLVIEQNENQLKTDSDTFGINFQAAYDKLVNACSAYRNAVGERGVADHSLAAAERQAGLGTISQIELEGARNAQRSALLAERKAYLAMLQARAAYDSAVSGNL